MDLAVHAFPDFFPGQVQHILLAQRARFSVRQLEPPVGVRTEQLRIFVDHLRFHPDAKLHAHLIDRVCQFLQTALQLSFIDKPVTQGGCVIITVSEPAVIHDQHVQPGLLRSLRESDQDVRVKVHHRRFPVIDQNRSVLRQPALFDEMTAVQVMVRSGHLPEAFSGIDQCHFRRLECVAGHHRPGESLRMDAHHAAKTSGLIDLRLRQEIAGIDQAHAPHLTHRLCGPG